MTFAIMACIIAAIVAAAWGVAGYVNRSDAPRMAACAAKGGVLVEALHTYQPVCVKAVN